MKSSEGLDCISLTSWRIRFTAGFFRLYLSAINSRYQILRHRLQQPPISGLKHLFFSESSSQYTRLEAKIFRDRVGSDARTKEKQSIYGLMKLRRKRRKTTSSALVDLTDHVMLPCLRGGILLDHRKRPSHSIGRSLWDL